MRTDFGSLEEKIAIETLERYSGSPIEEYCSYLLLTNFTEYAQYFSKSRKTKVYEGSQFVVAHSHEEDISLLVFRMGSPLASLTVDLCALAPFKAALFLGMCAGLRDDYAVGDYFMPVASIRGEGTSDFYLPPEVPAMANFVIQRAVSKILHVERRKYHVGICHTTNVRFWEFNQKFIEQLKATRAQALEMESATLFAASYARRLPLGALMIISDLPLSGGHKTKASARDVFEKYTAEHVELGVKIICSVRTYLEEGYRGASRDRS